VVIPLIVAPMHDDTSISNNRNSRAYTNSNVETVSLRTQIEAMILLTNYSPQLKPLITNVIVECSPRNHYRSKELPTALVPYPLNCSPKRSAFVLAHPDLSRSQQLQISVRISRTPSLVGKQPFHHAANGQGRMVSHAAVDNRNSTHPRLPDLLHQKSVQLLLQMPKARQEAPTERL
jgi:hypothetical protein